jgi:hypothetical protein
MFGVDVVTKMNNAGFLKAAFREQGGEPDKLCCDDAWRW